MAAISSTLEHLLARIDLSEADAGALLRTLTDESLPPAMAAALLVALRAKGETAAEVRGFATAMRGLARHFDLPPGLPAADIVGTGGDGSGSLNLSTGAALVAAACGLPIVKHGNRSVSSKSGSADVLEALGIRLPEDPDSAQALLSATNFTFLFAPELPSRHEGHCARAPRTRGPHGLQCAGPADESRRAALCPDWRLRRGHCPLAGRHPRGHADPALLRRPRCARLGRGHPGGPVHGLRCAPRVGAPAEARRLRTTASRAVRRRTWPAATPARTPGQSNSC